MVNKIIPKKYITSFINWGITASKVKTRVADPD